MYLVLLMGLLEDYFVPLHNFYLTPDGFDQKVRARLHRGRGFSSVTARRAASAGGTPWEMEKPSAAPGAAP